MFVLTGLNNASSIFLVAFCVSLSFRSGCDVEYEEEEEQEANFIFCCTWGGTQQYAVCHCGYPLGKFMSRS